MPTKAELQEEVDRLRQEREDLHQRIRDEVKRVAEKEGWCVDGQRESLARLGVVPESNRYKGTLMITIEFEGSLVTGPGGGVEPDAGWVCSSIQDRWNIGDFIAFDSDWENGEFTVTDTDVTNLEKVENT